MSYTATVSATYTLSVVLPGSSLHGYAWNVSVSASLPTAARTEISGSMVSQIPAGEEATFSLVIRDAFSNIVTKSGYTFTVSLLSAPPRSDVVNVNCSQQTYVCRYSSTVAGVYMLSVMKGTSHVLNSPYAVRVVPAGFDPAKSTISEASMVTAGSVKTFSVSGWLALIRICLF